MIYLKRGGRFWNEERRKGKAKKDSYEKCQII